MHELPEGLTKSLRSWRGSVYDSSHCNNDDLEKQVELSDKQFEQGPKSPAESSVVLVCVR